METHVLSELRVRQRLLRGRLLRRSGEGERVVRQGQADQHHAAIECHVATIRIAG